MSNKNIECKKPFWLMEWPGKLTKAQAIRLIDRLTDQDDPYWQWAVEDYYDEGSDSFPTIQHVFDALGITEQEYKDALHREQSDEV